MKFEKIIEKLFLLILCVSTAAPLAAMDLARAETRVDAAVSAYGVSGRGVIVAIFDRGIDWKNNDFRNDDGTTRIKYIFDLTDNTGANASGNPYGVGTIYTEAQINAALSGGAQLATRDAVGHGTSTSAIAAGNGRNSGADRKYRGVAPNASIIMVKFTTEGAPAHDDQPAEAAFYNPDLLQTAINFVKAKSAELSMPAVMLANFGSINGPTDGTSAFSRTIDANVGAGKPGLVFVNGTSDDGGMPNHAGGTITQGATTSIQIQKVTTGNLRFDLWYGGSDRFNVSLQTPAGNFGPYTAPANGSAGTVTNSTFSYNHRGVGTVFYGATNGKREILIDIAGAAGTYTIQLQGATVATGGGRFDATLNPSNIASAANNNRFLDNIVPGSVWDGSTAFNNIAPNSYNIRNAWTDIDGIARSIQNQGAINDIWRGSGTGPTFDGRLGVDVSAPGDSVFTTLNPTSYWATFRFNHIQDGNGFYTRASAVSAAAPQVTGIIALMLEKNPRLDAVQIRQMLRSSARSDAFTGTTPNTTWGYGKVDALGAVALAAQSVSRKTPLDFDGDGKTDFAVVRNTGGGASGQVTWFINGGNDLANYSTVPFGLATDNFVAGDFDGDGKSDIAVWRATVDGDSSRSYFYILQSNGNSFRAEQLGSAGDDPSIVGDYDGDGKTDVAVYRAGTTSGAQSYWFYHPSATPNVFFRSIPWGINGDFPAPGDYDGDGKADFCVQRGLNSFQAQFILQKAAGGIEYFIWGIPSDRVLPNDYDGDGKTDTMVVRNSGGQLDWYLQTRAGVASTAFRWGISSTDYPAPGDYDGDGKVDIAVWRPNPGAFYLRRSSDGAFQSFKWGQAGDYPVANFNVH